MSWMSGLSLVASVALLASCGGRATHDTTPRGTEIRLVPSIAEQAWYRSPSLCGQGPYEIELAASGIKWGEEFELRVSTPRRIAVHAVVLADDQEVERTAMVLDRDRRTEGKPDNVRCVADVGERLAASRGGGAGSPVGPGLEVGVRVTEESAPPAPPARTIALELEGGLVPSSVPIVRFGWREHGPRAQRIRFRLWSIEPNDLDGVRFGLVRVEWRPNVPEAEYEAWQARVAAAEAARLRRLEDEARRRHEEDDRRRRAQPARVTVEVDAKLELERHRQAEEARRRREQALRRKTEEAARRRAIELEMEAERQRRRKAYCATHPEDRDCWGAGGMRVHLELDARARQREQYCVAHADHDVRCWSDTERSRRALVWQQRYLAATAPPKQPDGPPPAPLDETPPPRLSENAEWRPGYWHWTGSQWAWLGGMWRVPESDIVADRTTVAPTAPPPPRVEVIPPPPMTTTVWVRGFWQWDGRAWVWIAGTYQLREAGASWAPAEWRPRGRVHVLVPGRWVRVRRGGR